jgi:hypothetical protein
MAAFEDLIVEIGPDDQPPVAVASGGRRVVSVPS